MTHWKDFARRNAAYSAPLRPSEDVVGVITGIIGRGTGPILLLGVTPELASAFDHVLAVDKSAEMISTVWPGDTARHKATRGDWLELELEPASLLGIVGDGSLNNISDTSAIGRFLSSCLNWLEPGCYFACRVFERPAKPFSIADIVSRAQPGDDFNFHALKWMIAMHLAEFEGSIVPVARIRSLFQSLFSDREQLAQKTSWPIEAIDTIDVYRGSELSYYFPSQEELLSLMPPEASSVRVSSSGSYPLSECCPIYSFAKSRGK